MSLTDLLITCVDFTGDVTLLRSLATQSTSALPFMQSDDDQLNVSGNDRQVLLIHWAFKLLGWFLHFPAAHQGPGVGAFWLWWSPTGVYLCIYILYHHHTFTAQRVVSYPHSWPLSIYPVSPNIPHSARWTKFSKSWLIKNQTEGERSRVTNVV